MKLIRQLGRVIFTLGAKSGDNKVSITVKPFKILIVVFPTQRMSTIQSGSGIQHPLPMHCKTTNMQLRLGRDGYPNTINNIVLFP
jgi:hypothetical protein